MCGSVSGTRPARAPTERASERRWERFGARGTTGRTEVAPPGAKFAVERRRREPRGAEVGIDRREDGGFEIDRSIRNPFETRPAGQARTLTARQPRRARIRCGGAERAAVYYAVFVHWIRAGTDGVRGLEAFEGLLTPRAPRLLQGERTNDAGSFRRARGSSRAVAPAGGLFPPRPHSSRRVARLGVALPAVAAAAFGTASSSRLVTPGRDGRARGRSAPDARAGRAGRGRSRARGAPAPRRGAREERARERDPRRRGGILRTLRPTRPRVPRTIPAPPAEGRRLGVRPRFLRPGTRRRHHQARRPHQPVCIVVECSWRGGATPTCGGRAPPPRPPRRHRRRRLRPPPSRRFLRSGRGRRSTRRRASASSALCPRRTRCPATTRPRPRAMSSAPDAAPRGGAPLGCSRDEKEKERRSGRRSRSGSPRPLSTGPARARGARGRQGLPRDMHDPDFDRGAARSVEPTHPSLGGPGVRDGSGRAGDPRGILRGPGVLRVRVRARGAGRGGGAVGAWGGHGRGRGSFRGSS